MANISEYISKIKTAIYGKDVRGALADGLDAVNKETEAATALTQETEQRQTSLEKQFDDQIANMTLADPSSAELVAARTNVNTGESYDTIGRRLDAEHADVTAQLAEKASQIDLDTQKSRIDNANAQLTDITTKKADQTYVDLVISTISQGGPKELFYSLSALNTKYPNGANITVLVFDSSFTDGAHSFIWDGTAWKDLGVYQAIGIPDNSVDAIKLIDTYGERIFSIGTPTDKYNYIGTDGKIVSGTGSAAVTTDYIGVSENTNYLLTAKVGQYLYPFAFYDANKNYIASSYATITKTGIYLITTPSTASYFRMSADYDKLNYVKLIKYTISEKTVDGAVLKDKSVKIDALVDSYSENIFNTGSVVPGQYITKNGSLATNNAQITTSDFIAVIPGNTYKIKVVFKSLLPYAFYDANKNYISGSYGTISNTSETLITAPLNAYYFRFTIDNVNLNSFRMVLVNNSRLAKGVNNLFGKTFHVLGDSMVHGHSLGFDKTWAYKLGQRNRMIVNDYGINGTCLAGTSNQFGASMATRFSSMADGADYIAVFGGTNDQTNGIPIGNDDDTTVDTFKGGLNVLCQGLLDKFPTAKIFFITPYNRNAEIKPYVDAIKTICLKYSVPVFDNFTNGGVCWTNANQISSLTMGDGFHLNETGHQYASTKYEAFMNSL